MAHGERPAPVTEPHTTELERRVVYLHSEVRELRSNFYQLQQPRWCRTCGAHVVEGAEEVHVVWHRRQGHR